MLSRRVLCALLVGLACGVLSGCSTAPPRVEHVVLIWLKEPVSPEAVDEVVSISRTFSRIPGVESLRVGRPLASERAVVDSSYHVGLAMTLHDQEALAGYLKHPIHAVASKLTLERLVDRIRVFDFEHGSP